MFSRFNPRLVTEEAARNWPLGNNKFKEFLKNAVSERAYEAELRPKKEGKKERKWKVLNEKLRNLDPGLLFQEC